MNKVGGSGLIVVAILLVLLGLVLRLGIIDWLIDVTGFLLILIGVVMGIVGLVQLFSGKGKSSSSF
ncbi:MAG: hypothetical protein IIB15_06765 [Chloroflexi bacterium]|nr:hypothetical protein [Chloroflexota bacterium]MCH8109814.1 hypothetical protein [Chloroflexota bacterium]